MPIDIIRVEQKALPYMPHGRDMTMSSALIYNINLWLNHVSHGPKQDSRIRMPWIFFTY